MRLIDADEFFKDFTELEPYEHISHEYNIDAVEVKHGEWIEDEYGFIHCSICGMEYDEPEHLKTNYCPNCGAKMKGEQE